MNKITEWLASPVCWASFAVIIITAFLFLVLKKLQKCFTDNNNGESTKRNIQIFPIISVFRFLLLIICVIAVLQINGINVTSLITGLGIVGIVVGFALQDFLKDLVMGVNIIWDKFFSIGDVVKFDNDFWEVVGLSLKVTKLRNIYTNCTMTICNRNISQIETISDIQYIIVPAHYDIDYKTMNRVCEKICKESEKCDLIFSCTYLGASEFKESYISYLICVKGSILDRYAVQRYVLKTIQEVYLEENLSIPYNQLDVHIDNKIK